MYREILLNMIGVSGEFVLFEDDQYTLKEDKQIMGESVKVLDKQVFIEYFWRINKVGFLLQTITWWNFKYK